MPRYSHDKTSLPSPMPTAWRYMRWHRVPVAVAAYAEANGKAIKTAFGVLLYAKVHYRSHLRSKDAVKVSKWIGSSTKTVRRALQQCVDLNWLTRNAYNGVYSVLTWSKIAASTNTPNGCLIGRWMKVPLPNEGNGQNVSPGKVSAGIVWGYLAKYLRNSQIIANKKKEKERGDVRNKPQSQRHNSSPPTFQPVASTLACEIVGYRSASTARNARSLAVDAKYIQVRRCFAKLDGDPSKLADGNGAIELPATVYTDLKWVTGPRQRQTVKRGNRFDIDGQNVSHSNPQGYGQADVSQPPNNSSYSDNTRNIDKKGQHSTLSILKRFNVDSNHLTATMRARLAKCKCVMCGRPLTGKSVSTCPRPAPCRNAKSNAVHDVVKSIATELNQRPHLEDLLTKDMIQQRIDNRLKRAYINYRQRPQVSEIYGLPLF